MAILIIIGASCTERDSNAPNVVETFPASGRIDVDPSITEITVTFDEAMKDGSWSWAYSDKNKFPEMTEQEFNLFMNNKKEPEKLTETEKSIKQLSRLFKKF